MTLALLGQVAVAFVIGFMWGKIFKAIAAAAIAWLT